MHRQSRGDLQSVGAMSVNIQFERDASGFPSIIKIRKRGRLYEAVYDRNSGITFNQDFPEDIIQYLKLFYPFPDVPRAFYETGELVANDADVDAFAAEVVTVLYTVPANKKLFILNAYSCISNGAVGTFPYGDIHVYDPIHNLTIEPIAHRWLYANTEVMSKTSSEIQVAFPPSFVVRLLTGVQSSHAGGFIGVIKDL